MDNIITIKGLGKSFKQKNSGSVQILRDIDLTIASGKTLCVLGESGCGKTTLGKIIAGLIPYTSGSYKFMGKEVKDLKGKDWFEFRNSVQLIHQNPYESLNPSLMVFDMIANPIRRHQKIKSIPELYKKVTELLEVVGLTPVEDFVDKYPATLSGGQRQRVSIARVLAMNPKLIVVDEATSMIDTSLRVSLLGTLRDIQQKLNVSYFFITHDLALGRYFARGQDVIIMYLGRTVEQATTEDIVDNPVHPYTKAVISAAIGTSEILEKRIISKYTLTGTDIPSFANIPNGCPLHPRCPQAVKEICSTNFPEMQKTQNGHKVACILAKGG